MQERLAERADLSAPGMQDLERAIHPVSTSYTVAGSRTEVVTSRKA